MPRIILSEPRILNSLAQYGRAVALYIQKQIYVAQQSMDGIEGEIFEFEEDIRLSKV